MLNMIESSTNKDSIKNSCSKPVTAARVHPAHLDVRRILKNIEGDVITQADMDPGIQVNTWTGSVSPPMVAAARLPPATEDMVTLEDVYTDEEKLHCSLLSSESAFLLFNTAVHPASATDSGEEESDDSLAPPTSTQYHPSKEESVDRAVITLTYGSDNVDRIDRIIDRTACSDINRQQHALNADAVLHNSTVEDSNWTGIQKAAVLQCEIKRCEPHDATVRIQSWWRGHRTRYCHPQAKEVRAEIRLRRMQDHIVHLTVELVKQFTVQYLMFAHHVIRCKGRKGIQFYLNGPESF
ncbi:centrosomal protein of 97 kDa-like isoform X2 [Carassius auratus]|nr:centrosomal protein of 97 kDa-like isoform X2 [Carassius auratus]